MTLTRLSRLLFALVFTPVGGYFLWPSTSSHGEHGHDEHSDESDEKEEDQTREAQEEPPQEKQPQRVVFKDEPSLGEKQEENEFNSDERHEANKETEGTARPSGTEGDPKPKCSDANKKSFPFEDTEERVPRSGPASTKGVYGKGRMKKDSKGMNQTSKREPDGKGAFKNRKDSGLQKDLSSSSAVYADDKKTESVCRNIPSF